ncbi:MAG TPA: ATP-dependent DNA ligase [Gemmatimonadota bacterium]|jgi:DNA ligase-1
MLLNELVETSAAVAATRARNRKIALLAALLRRLEAAEVDVAVAYLSGELRQRRIGLGWASLRAHLGTPAPEAPSLPLLEVDAVFERLAGTSGRGSAAGRRRLLGDLMGRATAPERDFLGRLVVGELRQGALAGIVAEALAAAAAVPAAEVRRALLFAGDLREVARAALREGSPGLARFSLQLLRPLQPMLAQPAEALAEALAGLPEAALEWKLDGARVQVHKEGGEIRVFSRLLNEVTPAVPELVEAVRTLPARSLVLDGEVIALRADGSPQPFQLTMRRFGRKLDVDALRRELPLSPFFFDALHLDGEDLLDRPAADRFAALGDALPPALVVPRLITTDPAAAEAFLAEALRRGHEGVMVKDPRSTYEAGRRGRAWLKVKAARTLDLVVLAAEWGHGRRRGWLSNLHLGARDERSGELVMLGKTFKGLTDEMLAWQTRQLLARERERDEWTVYVRPELVVEVAFSDVQASSRYPGGMALRFARVKRYRPDKTAAEADTLDAVRAIFEGSTAQAHGS